MADDDTHEAAEQMWREVMGFDPPPADDAFMELTVDHVFGRIWTRPGLSTRERRLVSLTAAATAGQSGPLAIHLGAAVRSGDLSVDELHEWVVQLAHYAGWPAGATAYTALREAEAQRKD
jgi:4-carboxymuconolactone decarboxylase